MSRGRHCAAPAVAVAVAALITPRKATQNNTSAPPPHPPGEAALLAPPPQSPPGLERARLLGLDTAEEEVLAQLELDLLARLATHVGEGDDQRASRGRELLAQGLDRQKAGEMGGFGNGALEHLKQWRGAPRGPASSWECRAARSRRARLRRRRSRAGALPRRSTLTTRWCGQVLAVHVALHGGAPRRVGHALREVGLVEECTAAPGRWGAVGGGGGR